ncbi:MAG TPA: hypothetical protein VFW44_22585 [Bryobacteraceae bacterium]|nr:hypothetical protein [Bryobacteraceae bacterium]
MLRLLLLIATAAYAQQTSTPCSNTALAQTETVHGPLGASTALKVTSADDASKNTHDCMADYVLVVHGAKTGEPELVKLLSSDGNWGRRLVLHIDGFTKDGSRIFGILAEDGRFAFTTLFEYRTKTGKVRLTDLRRASTALAAAKCGAGLAVAGTTKGGAIVLRPDTTDPCADSYRWRLNPSTGDIRQLPDPGSIIGLYDGTRPQAAF